MIRIFFASIDLAIAHAKAHGGWIAQCADGSNQWFDASKYTLTPIISTLTKERSGDAKIGPWPLFDPGHASHALVTK